MRYKHTVPVHGANTHPPPRVLLHPSALVIGKAVWGKGHKIERGAAVQRHEGVTKLVCWERGWKQKTKVEH